MHNKVYVWSIYIFDPFRAWEEQNRMQEQCSYPILNLKTTYKQDLVINYKNNVGIIK